VLRFILLTFLSVVLAVHHYSNGLAIILALNQIKFYSKRKINVFQMLEIFQVLDNHAGKAIGFDVSEYQGKINWVMWIPWK
jgi:lysozyme